MNTTDLTLVRSFKFLWSFYWRAWLLTLPVFAVLMPFMFMMSPLPKPGETPKPPDPKLLPWFFIAWVACMAGGLLTQAVAIRWATKAKWSDFRVAIINASEQE